ncbi:phage portal protein [Streptomyces sp. NPDC058368]|uniref:phage portal protein n=1 Tax=Streptomyces sp. NPDC058368 TaxID=3346461 RepID=UPI003646CAA2
MATIEQALHLVQLLEAELSQRGIAIARHNAYYQGRHPLKFASEEFAKFHGDRYREFSDNWVQVVGDSPVERMTVTGFQASGDTSADQELWKVWQVNGLDADSQLGFLGSVVNARSFVLVWGDPDDEDIPIVTFEDPGQCVIAYEPGSRRLRRAALKRWQDGDEDYATLYLPDEVWKFCRPHLVQSTDKSPQMSDVDEALKRWRPRDMGSEPNPQPNPMGVVPMVELPNKPSLAADPISDVHGVIAMQDAINLLWAQLFTASDYASFPQRVIMGAERPVLPVLNEKGEVIATRPVDIEKFAVDRVMMFNGKDVHIGEWQAANLTMYTSLIEVAVGHLAAQTRTPQHYLVGKMANLAEGALLAAETGLVKRVEEKQIWSGQGLREMARLIALARGEKDKAKALRSGRVLWKDAESRSHAQLSDALLKLKQIGFPFEWLALRYGLTPTEVADVIAMREREVEMDPVSEITRQLTGTAGPAPQEEPGEESALEEVAV